MDLLFHLSPKKLKNKIKVYDGYISLSKNEFVSKFGKWIYIFNYTLIKKDFKLERYYSNKNIKNRFEYSFNAMGKDYKFLSAKLKSEYRIFKDIDLKKYCIGSAKHFDESKDIIQDKIISKIIK